MARAAKRAVRHQDTKKKNPASGLGRKPARTASDRLGPRRHQATDDAEYEMADRSGTPAREARLPEGVGGRRLDRQGDELHPGEAIAAHDAPSRCIDAGCGVAE